MEKYSLLARVVAKAGKEADVANFLKSALALAQAEEGTIRWYGLQLNENTFGIFDTFATTDARQAHLDGEIARLLMENAAELLEVPPVIEFVELLAVK